MTRCEYLLSLRGKNNKEIRDTWAALGEMTATSQTKLYSPNTIFQVKSTGDLGGSLVYCVNEYKVDNDAFGCIDWEQASQTGIEGDLSIHSGITSPHFKVLLSKAEFMALSEEPVDYDLIPFEGLSLNSLVNIDDEELKILLAPLGVPFLRIEELEFTRDMLKGVCIRPALDTYYEKFPIVEEQNYGMIGSNSEYTIPFKDGAYSGIPYFTIGSNGGGVAPFGIGAKNYLSLYGGLAGNSSVFGTGLKYNKRVPGFTGGNGAYANAMMAAQAQQAIINSQKREKHSKIKIDGKKYLKGFCSIGGYLNIKWLKASYDWDDVPFKDLTNVRKLCQSHILTNLGLLRSQVKSDLAGKIDYTLFTTKGENLEKAVMDEWNESSAKYMYAIMRGGLN